MTATDVSSQEASAPSPVSRPRLMIVGALAALALGLTALVVLGGIVAVAASGATVIAGADGGTILEWAPPLSVWQWLIAGLIEFVLIAGTAAAAWGASTVWHGRLGDGGKNVSVRPLALGACIAMIAATVLALLVHIRNWTEWHSLISQHPEWGESAQSWQIPVGAAVAFLIVADVVAGYGFLRRRTRRVR